jgi:hypothetical protein
VVEADSRLALLGYQPYQSYFGVPTHLSRIVGVVLLAVSFVPYLIHFRVISPKLSRVKGTER